MSFGGIGLMPLDIQLDPPNVHCQNYASFISIMPLKFYPCTSLMKLPKCIIELCNFYSPLLSTNVNNHNWFNYQFTNLSQMLIVPPTNCRHYNWKQKTKAHEIFNDYFGGVSL
jgi:hypothetical protein